MIDGKKFNEVFYASFVRGSAWHVLGEVDRVGNLKVVWKNKIT